MRQNTPALIDPRNTVQSSTDRQLGVVSPVSIEDEIAELKRHLTAQNAEIARLRSMFGGQRDLTYASPQILTTRGVKGSMSTTNSTTGGATITNSNLGPLIAGIPYLVIAIAGMALNAPAGQTIYACVRIEASGTTVDGTQTTTVGGERWGIAMDMKVVMGAGSSINTASRSRTSSGTGTVNDAMHAAWAIPLGAMIELWGE
jgi:hypothetical protein